MYMVPEIKKKTRTMTPELLEKLAKAREKGREILKAKREATEKAKRDEIMKKTFTDMKFAKGTFGAEEQSDSDSSIRARYEERKPRKAKYEGVRKVVKKKVVYMVGSDTDSDIEEVKPTRSVLKVPSVPPRSVPKAETTKPTTTTGSQFEHYLSMF